MELVVGKSGLWVHKLTRDAAEAAMSLATAEGKSVRLLDPRKYCVRFSFNLIDVVATIAADLDPIAGESQEEIDSVQRFVADSSRWWMGGENVRNLIDLEEEGDVNPFDLLPWSSGSDFVQGDWDLDWGDMSPQEAFEFGRLLLVNGIAGHAFVRPDYAQIIMDRQGARVLAGRLKRNYDSLLAEYSEMRYRQAIEEGISEWFEFLASQPGELN